VARAIAGGLAANPTRTNLADLSVQAPSKFDSGPIEDSVKTYLWSITHGAWPSGKPNECARAGTGTVARDEGGHTSFAYLIGDLPGGLHAAAIADERDNHLLVGMTGADWIDLIRLLLEGFGILIIDLADYINKHSADAVSCMNRDSR
jgi:hypothetical protein